MIGETSSDRQYPLLSLITCACTHLFRFSFLSSDSLFSDATPSSLRYLETSLRHVTHETLPNLSQRTFKTPKDRTPYLPSSLNRSASRTRPHPLETRLLSSPILPIASRPPSARTPLAPLLPSSPSPPSALPQPQRVNIPPPRARQPMPAPDDRCNLSDLVVRDIDDEILEENLPLRSEESAKKRAFLRGVRRRGGNGSRKTLGFYVLRAADIPQRESIRDYTVYLSVEAGGR